MDTLVAVGTGIAFLYSTCSLVAGIANPEYHPNLVYDTATMVGRCPTRRAPSAGGPAGG